MLHTTTETWGFELVASTSIGTGMGIRPRSPSDYFAAKSSELPPAALSIHLCLFPFHTLLAISNALDKHFLDFWQVCWCLVSALTCKKGHLHEHIISSVEALPACSIESTWFRESLCDESQGGGSSSSTVTGSLQVQVVLAGVADLIKLCHVFILTHVIEL